MLAVCCQILPLLCWGAFLFTLIVENCYHEIMINFIIWFADILPQTQEYLAVLLKCIFSTSSLFLFSESPVHKYCIIFFYYPTSPWLVHFSLFPFCCSVDRFYWSIRHISIPDIAILLKTLCSQCFISDILLFKL